MPRLVTEDQLGRLSGGGWALGYVGGLISLIFMAAFILVDTQTGKTMLGLDPLLKLDVATREMDRIVGPFSALWYAVFIIPFFLFTPDAPANPNAQRRSMREAITGLGETLRHIGRYRNLVVFFIARMLFIDGLLAIFTFGGIYATSIFGWQTIVVGYFGIILSVAAGIGALIGGFLDDQLGSKPVIIGSVALLIIGSLGVMSIDASHIFFTLDVTPRPPGSAPFVSTGEIFYMAFAILIGLASGPSQAACRSLLARLAPAEHMSEFFGFFAFSGKVTAFAAPFIIGIVSDTTGSLQMAMSVILAFLLAGMVGMGFVRTERV
jgi:UMF1 family MFS transporter